MQPEMSFEAEQTRYSSAKTILKTFSATDCSFVSHRWFVQLPHLHSTSSLTDSALHHANILQVAVMIAIALCSKHFRSSSICTLHLDFLLCPSAGSGRAARNPFCSMLKEGKRKQHSRLPRRGALGVSSKTISVSHERKAPHAIYAGRYGSAACTRRDAASSK